MSFFTITMYTSFTVNLLAGNWAIAAVSLAVAVAHNALDVRAEYAADADEAPVPSPEPIRRR